MKDTMTPKERWLAAVHLRPVDRLPFWPKLEPSYRGCRDAPFRDMELDVIHDWIGSDKHTGIGGPLREVRRTTAIETTVSDELRRTVYRTPFGNLEQISRFDAPSHSWHPVRFPVQSIEDVRRMTVIFEDVYHAPDAAACEAARERARQIGQGALTANVIGESPLMHWVEWLAGVENAHYLLHDCRDEVEALFEAMHRSLLRRTELWCEYSAADVVYFSENTSTTLISPEQYRRYCARHIGAYAAICRDAGRPLILHMCGLLKALLPQLAAIPVRAFEAFTSPSLGNTTLLDGRTQCPDKCLIGGTNAVLWTRPAKDIIAQIERDLDGLPHHRGLVVTSAGVMPPICAPETIRAVCDWVKRYPARMHGE